MSDFKSKKPEDKTFPLKFLIGVLVILCIFLFRLYNNAETNRLRLLDEITEMESRHSREMEALYEEKESLKEEIEILETELGR